MPAFSVWTTDYDQYKQYSGRKEVSVENFFRNRLEDFRRFGLPPYRLIAEALWMQLGRPYYNIHQGILPHLVRVDLSKIPSNLIELPPQYPVINIRFCQPHPAITLSQPLGTGELSMPKDAWVHGMLMVDFRHVAPVRQKVQIIFNFDQYRMVQGQRQPVYTIFDLELNETSNLEMAFGASVGETTRSPDYRRVVLNCLKLAVTVGFMATSSKDMVSPDVLAAYRDEYYSLSTPPERKKWIEEKSQRRGKAGWNIGNDVMFLEGTVGTHNRGSSSSDEGRELSHAHIRGGHLHAVRFGPKHSRVKIMWFRPTTVRSDLSWEFQDE